MSVSWRAKTVVLGAALLLSVLAMTWLSGKNSVASDRPGQAGPSVTQEVDFEEMFKTWSSREIRLTTLSDGRVYEMSES
jgi:hypothetical protein